LHNDVSPTFVVTREDFGSEAVEPKFSTLLAKWQAVDNFQRQCDLSHIMVRLLKFQAIRAYQKDQDWAGGVDMSQLLEVTSIHAELKAWRQTADFPFMHTGQAAGIGNCDAPSRLTYIFYE
jgi:hypothetical protein